MDLSLMPERPRREAHQRLPSFDISVSKNFWYGKAKPISTASHRQKGGRTFDRTGIHPPSGTRKEQVYRTAAIHLDSPSAAVDAVDEA